MFFTSFVEGAQIPLQEAMDFLQRGTEPESIQEQMIWNNRRAWAEMTATLYRPLEGNFVRGLAFMLTEEMDDCAEDYRQTDRHPIAAMNNESYEVPPAYSLPDRMNEYYDFLQNTHFYPAWRQTPIDQISTKVIQDFLCEKKYLSPKYLHDMRVFLAQIMDSALRDGWIEKNPATDSRIYNPSQKQVYEREALSMEAVKDIIPSLHALDRMDRLYLALVIFTGMRRGEVLGLRWEDVDLEQNVLHVQRNVTYTNDQPFVGTPKTKSGFREVPIIPDLLAHLLPLGEKGFIVSGNDPEKPLTLTAFRCMMKRINASVDLHGATSHVFRHTIGTMLNDTGADVKTIQSILGQSDFKTTMDRYVHPRDNKKQEAIKNVSLLLQN